MAPSRPASITLYKRREKKGIVENTKIQKKVKRVLDCNENLPTTNKVTPLGYYNPNYNAITTLLVSVKLRPLPSSVMLFYNRNVMGNSNSEVMQNHNEKGNNLRM